MTNMTNKQNIFIEGCDCVGKTSLVKEFLDYQDWKVTTDPLIVKHFTSPPSNLSKEQQILYQKNLYKLWINKLNRRTGYLLDRFLLGEAVYSPVYRNYYPDYIRDFESQLNEHNVLIMLTAKPEIVRQRFDGKFIKNEDIETILSSYDKEFDLCKIKRKLKIDTSIKKPFEVFKEVMDYIAKS